MMMISVRVRITQTGAGKDPSYEGAEDFLKKFGEILKKSVNKNG